MKKLKEILPIINRAFIDNIINGEFNDETTRNRVYDAVKKGLFDLGVDQFDITCDERNNPPSVIESNNIKIDVAFRCEENKMSHACTIYETSSDDMLARGVLVQTPVGLMRASDLPHGGNNGN
ncbi:MAG: hypothetical protein QM489_01165 [Candidatus Izemoplasma sp.]